MKNHALEQTSAVDEKIIDMYWQRDPDAIQKTDQQYGPLLRNVAYNILFDTLDCEECQNDAYLKIWNTIPSTRPPKFYAYIMQIIRQIAIDRYREKSRQKRIPSQLTVSLEELESMGGGPSVEDLCEAKELGRLISDYVRSLNKRQRYIFFDRYYMAEPVEKTAADLSISVRTAYYEIGKIRQGLKEYLEGNGVRV